MRIITKTSELDNLLKQAFVTSQCPKCKDAWTAVLMIRCDACTNRPSVLLAIAC